MRDSRFLDIVNASLGRCGLDPTAPASPADPRAVETWASFLAACVEQGVSLTDPRWAQLRVAGPPGTPRLVLPAEDAGAEPDAGGDDFRVGLSLLVSLLGGRDASSLP